MHLQVTQKSSNNAQLSWKVPQSGTPTLLAVVCVKDKTDDRDVGTYALPGQQDCFTVPARLLAGHVYGVLVKLVCLGGTAAVQRDFRAGKCTTPQ